GGSGAARLEITAGGIVDSGRTVIGASAGDPDSERSAQVAGENSTWNIGELFAIGNYDSGSLEVADGGQVNSLAGTIVGGESGAKGSVSVHGTDAVWNSAGDIALGWQGGASLSVTEGGEVIAGEMNVGSQYSQ